MSSYEEQKINDTQGKEMQLPCSKCAGKTAHKVLLSVDQSGGHEHAGNSFDWNEHHQIIQCLGCKVISFRKASTNSEDYDHDDDGNVEYFEAQQLYPSRVEGRRPLADSETFYIPSSVRAVYVETVMTLANQSPILTGIGVRALIEAVCKERKAKGSNLLRKIDHLVEQRLLTPAGANTLHKIRSLGNAAAHEVKPHTDKQLGLAMNVVEHLLRDVYILPKLVAHEFAGDDNKDVD